jgi:hypothetical protein
VFSTRNVTLLLGRIVEVDGGAWSSLVDLLGGLGKHLLGGLGEHLCKVREHLLGGLG